MPEVLLGSPTSNIDRVQAPPASYKPDEDTYYQFGEIEVDVRNRTVTCHGAILKMGSRAFDLLVVLLKMRGTVADKRHIMHQVWPSTTVDDSNLRFQMTCLRRALGSSCDVIKTIPGRGYFFVASSVRVARRESFASATDRSGSLQLIAVGEVPATVAIVEDDENVREALDGLLRSFGFSVNAYASSRAFFDAGPAAAECIVLDVCLPGRSGLDVQAELNAAGLNVPIIFISGHADVPMSVKAMKAGAMEFLTKPVRHEEILLAVKAAVGHAASKQGVGYETSW